MEFTNKLIDPIYPDDDKIRQEVRKALRIRWWEGSIEIESWANEHGRRSDAVTSGERANG